MKRISILLSILLILPLAGCNRIRLGRVDETDESTDASIETHEDETVLTKASRIVFRLPEKTDEDAGNSLTDKPNPTSQTTSTTQTTQATSTTHNTPPTPATYTIQAGDTLYSLAREFNTTIEAITSLNGIVDETRIDVGQVIQIPDGSIAPTPTIDNPTSPPQGDYSSISNTDLSWWYQAGPPSTIPNDVANLLAEHRVFWKLPHGRSVVYLTIDEGYEFETNTAEILQTLKDKNVKATFFVTGSYVDTNPTLIRQMVNDGHQIGNHTVNHYRASTALDQSEDLFIEDVVSLNQHVPEMTKLHRPPEGGYSERSLQILDDLGYTTVFWSFAYRDWLTDDQPDPETAKQMILNNLHPGSILLLHAVSNTNVAIMGEVIDGIRAAGYTIELLPE